MSDQYTPNLNKLLEERRILLSKIEVFNFSLAQKNREIAKELETTFLGKKIRFEQSNNVMFIDGSGQTFVRIPGDVLFVVRQIRFANTFDDITYMLTPVYEGPGPLYITQNQFKDFRIE